MFKSEVQALQGSKEVVHGYGRPFVTAGSEIKMVREPNLQILALGQEKISQNFWQHHRIGLIASGVATRSAGLGDGALST